MNLKKIELDYQKHSDHKREMFRAWLRTSTNPTYDDVIKALEAVGENAVARNLCDPVNALCTCTSYPYSHTLFSVTYIIVSKPLVTSSHHHTQICSLHTSLTLIATTHNAAYISDSSVSRVLMVKLCLHSWTCMNLKVASVTCSGEWVWNWSCEMERLKGMWLYYTLDYTFVTCS